MSILAINQTLMCDSLTIISLSLGHLLCDYSWLGTSKKETKLLFCSISCLHNFIIPVMPNSVHDIYTNYHVMVQYQMCL